MREKIKLQANDENISKKKNFVVKTPYLSSTEMTFGGGGGGEGMWLLWIVK